jgi:hypothetical protein
MEVLKTAAIRIDKHRVLQLLQQLHLPEHRVLRVVQAVLLLADLIRVVQAALEAEPVVGAEVDVFNC